jgi:hypothetical protein
MQIYIIIWLSLYVLSVHSLSPPKPVGLDLTIFRRRTLYYMLKSLGIFLLFIFFKLEFCWFEIIFLENLLETF